MAAHFNHKSVSDVDPNVIKGGTTKPRYLSATKSSAAKCRIKTPVNKPKIGDQQWNASTKIDNPDGPIKPLPPMINYRAKMDASHKKRTELLKIKANQQKALELNTSYQSRPANEQQFEIAPADKASAHKSANNQDALIINNQLLNVDTAASSPKDLTDNLKSKVIHDDEKIESSIESNKDGDDASSMMNSKSIDGGNESDQSIICVMVENDAAPIDEQCMIGTSNIEAFDPSDFPWVTWVPMDKYEDFARVYCFDETKNLGTGAGGSVFQGVAIGSDKKVAVKKINKFEVYDWGSVNGHVVPLEYCLLNILSKCDGVVKLLNAYETEHEYFLVFNTLHDFMTLEQYICQFGPAQDMSLARKIFCDLLTTVDECHKAGVYHRDLKEPNILIDLQGGMKPMLIDFGIAALVAHSPYDDYAGTPGYMAPELSDYSKSYDGLPAEIFSLGVILDDMMYGTLAREPLTNAFGFKPKVSAQCQKLIDAMVNQVPENRPTLDEIFSSRWIQENFLE